MHVCVCVCVCVCVNISIFMNVYSYMHHFDTELTMSLRSILVVYKLLIAFLFKYNNK